MQFNRLRKQKLTGERNPELYAHSLQFYKYVPHVTISLEEFEKLALERLQVLRIIERATAKFKKNSKDYMDQILSDLRKSNLLSYCEKTVENHCGNDVIYDKRKNDHISHFILRLAYCKSEFLRGWFLAQEMDLFRLRLECENPEQRKRFMKLNDLDYNPIDSAEKKDLVHMLVTSEFNNTTSRVLDSNYYKVPFTEVIDLIKQRRVYLKKGFVYLHENDLISIIVTAFRTHLSHALSVTARILPQLEEDHRLLNILNTIHVRYIGDDYSKRKIDYSGDVVPEMLDDHSKTSFPLCMKVLHDNLRSTHHLKYHGRLQYGLFLKGLGLTLEDSLRFWREEFTKTVDMDKFEKQYAYGIRYNYGKEGKRANFTPYNCMKIITTNPPGPGDCHGCPFKHSDSSNLRQQLSKLQIGNTAISGIMDMTSKGHFQLACTQYFEATHNGASIDQGINHPNKYFEESIKLKKAGKTKDTKTVHISQIQTSQAKVYDKPTVAAEDMDTEFDEIEMADIEDLLKNGI